MTITTRYTEPLATDSGVITQDGHTTLYLDGAPVINLTDDEAHDFALKILRDIGQSGGLQCELCGEHDTSEFMNI